MYCIEKIAPHMSITQMRLDYESKRKARLLMFMTGINTISHDEENRHPNSRYGVTDGFGMQRKTHSQKRPQIGIPQVLCASGGRL